MSGGKEKTDSLAGQGNRDEHTPLPKIDLRDAHAIRREMATLYRDMRGKRIGTQDGTRLAYVLNMLRQAVETSELQDRLDALEEKIERRKLHAV